MELLPLDAPEITNLLALILVVVTAAYVYLTRQIAQANRGMLEDLKEQYRDSIRPVMYASLRFREQVVARLAITNAGRSPAYDLRISLDKDFYQFAEPAEDRNLRRFSLFNDTIETFAPGSEIVVDLAQGFNFGKEVNGKDIAPRRLRISFSYRSKFEHYSEDMIIDLTPYLHTHTPKAISEHLDAIEKHLKRLAGK